MKPVNQMSRAQLLKERAANSARQDVLTTKLIELGYGRVMSFELHTLDIAEAQEKDALMRRMNTISMELDSIQLGYRKATVAILSLA